MSALQKEDAAATTPLMSIGAGGITQLSMSAGTMPKPTSPGSVQRQATATDFFRKPSLSTQRVLGRAHPTIQAGPLRWHRRISWTMPTLRRIRQSAEQRFPLAIFHPMAL